MSKGTDLTYTQLVQRVNELQAVHRDWEELNSRLKDLEDALEPILGTQTAEEPLVVHQVRVALRDLKAVFR